MNNNRLSTFPRFSPVNRALLETDIHKLLNGESNFEVMPDGKIFIKSLKKYYSDRAKIRVVVQDESVNVLNTFASLTDCAKDPLFFYKKKGVLRGI